MSKILKLYRKREDVESEMSLMSTEIWRNSRIQIDEKRNIASLFEAKINHYYFLISAIMIVLLISAISHLINYNELAGDFILKQLPLTNTEGVVVTPEMLSAEGGKAKYLKTFNYMDFPEFKDNTLLMLSKLKDTILINLTLLLAFIVPFKYYNKKIEKLKVSVNLEFVKTSSIALAVALGLMFISEFLIPSASIGSGIFFFVFGGTIIICLAVSLSLFMFFEHEELLVSTSSKKIKESKGKIKEAKEKELKEEKKCNEKDKISTELYKEIEKLIRDKDAIYEVISKIESGEIEDRDMRYTESIFEKVKQLKAEEHNKKEKLKEYIHIANNSFDENYQENDLRIENS